ncbi:MFS transporter [Paludicola sp. MB14-C6]|uniref:MFS transporter n=1 Tax=Paludihabitans sp. MB14-C6 TaxID=3070656 RepID=UPI0027DBC103|nr:MFS transporter [Paludicola sp. MB14-C6]WMJ22055.1 MFS transporter [Paludicola sp. MB14-C6]
MVFYAPVATLYRKSQGITVFQIAIIECIYMVLILFLEFPWGVIADKIGYKNTILISNSIYFLSKIIFWQANSFSMFIFERILLAFALSGQSGCDSAFLYESIDQKKANKVFGIWQSMGTLGILIASLSFTFLSNINYKSLGLLTVIAYSMALFLSLFLKEPTKKKDNKKEKLSIKEAVNSFFNLPQQFFLFLIGSALLVESNQTITVFLSQLQYTESGISVSNMGYLYILLTISEFASLFSHRLVTKLGQNKTGNMLFLFGTIACFILSLFHNAILSVLGILLLRIATSLFFPISMEIQNQQISKNRATILSIYSIAMNIVSLIPNLLFGISADYSIRISMLLGCIFCFTGFICFNIWLRKKQ